MWGGHGILHPAHLKNWGDTSAVSTTKLRPCFQLVLYQTHYIYTCAVLSDDFTDNRRRLKTSQQVWREKLH